MSTTVRQSLTPCAAYQGYAACISIDGREIAFVGADKEHLVTVIEKLELPSPVKKSLMTKVVLVPSLK